MYLTPNSSASQAMRRLLGDAADLRHVGLDDVEGATLQERQEALPAGQHLAAGDRHGLWRRSSQKSSMASGFSASSNQPAS